mmetsp:Transcript_34552/g.35221  ORF Transcript_34552/g.35221 Transcript_34552/m.35221 type:complete len:293 (-) Transcript_34552:6-884(-)
MTQIFLILILLLFKFIKCSPHYKSKNFSLVVIAPHKSASMLLYSYFKRLSWAIHAKLFSVHNDQSLILTEDEVMEKFLPESPPKIFVPIRTFLNETLWTKIIAANENNFIFHYRDPLDVAISEYYSFGYTHHLPPKNSSLYNSILNERKHIRETTREEYIKSKRNQRLEFYRNVAKLISNVGCRIKVLYYDQIVNNKSQWNHETAKYLSLPHSISNPLVKVLQDGALKHLSFHIHNPQPGSMQSGLSSEFIQEFRQEIALYTKSIEQHSNVCTTLIQSNRHKNRKSSKSKIK